MRVDTSRFSVLGISSECAFPMILICIVFLAPQKPVRAPLLCILLFPTTPDHTPEEDNGDEFCSNRN